MQPDPVYIFYMGATPEKVWEAITGAEGVRKMFFGARSGLCISVSLRRNTGSGTRLRCRLYTRFLPVQSRPHAGLSRTVRRQPARRRDSCNWEGFTKYHGRPADRCAHLPNPKAKPRLQHQVEVVMSSDRAVILSGAKNPSDIRVAAKSGYFRSKSGELVARPAPYGFFARLSRSE